MDDESLLRAWERGCGGYSLTHQMARHPLFARIVERGQAVLPAAFALYADDAWIGWSTVLSAVTRESPELPAGTAEDAPGGTARRRARRRGSR